MNDFYLVVCTNRKTNDQRVFCALLRIDAEALRDAFLQNLSDLSDWSVFIVRGVEE